MKNIKLRDLEVTELGFGCMNIAWAYGPATERKKAVELIQSAYNQGIRLFDTAEVYGPFYSEEVLGEALKGIRDKCVIATKFGFDINPETCEINGNNSQPQHIKKVVERMLKRLQTDYIDLLYQHRIDPNVPIEDVAGAVGDLVREGKVKHFGLSEVGSATIRRANAEFPVTAVQNEYSFWVRNAENEVLPTCEELGIGFVAWSPLGMGYLTGKITSQDDFSEGNILKSLNFPRFSNKAIQKNRPILELLEKIAQRHNASTAQIALAWLLARKPYIVPIPGTKSIKHMTENNQSVNIVLSSEDLQELENEFSKITIIGDRAPEMLKSAHDIGVNNGENSANTHGGTPLRK